MSFFDKTAYLRVLLSTLPLGIVLLYYGVNGLITLPSEKELTKHSGYIDTIRVEKVYYKYLKGYEESYLINLKEIDTVFISPMYMHGDTLKKYLPTANCVTIWHSPKVGKTEIEKLEIDGKRIIEYKNRSWIVYLLAIFFGFPIIILSIYYLIKYPEDLFGKSKLQKKRR